MRPREAFNALEVVVKSLPPSFCREGVVLSEDDNCTVTEVYLQWFLLLLDLQYLRPETFVRDTTRLWRDISKEDVMVVNNAFAECLHAVRTQTHKGFKALCGLISSHLYNFLKEDFQRVLTGDVFAAKRLIQVFSYTSRINLRDIDLTQQLISEYVANEDSMKVEFDKKLIFALNNIMRSWLGPIQPYEIVPKHGPGGVAERGRCSLEEKYKLLFKDYLTEYAFKDAYPVYASLSPCRRSKTIFVPKSYKTQRTISMEPATLQFLQQGVRGVLERQIQSSKYLSSRFGFSRPRQNPGYLKARIDTKDQLRNRRLAQVGSAERSYATLDLSAASDSVSYALVKQVFRGTWMSRYIVTTRSTETELPDGQILKLKKFAPMGSSLCFPIETLIFACVCEYVTREHRVTGDYSVYGDDIIVPTRCVESTIQLLEELGFRVNRSKSFFQQECWFRESCGGEYCDGFDVTPIKISRKYNSRELDVKAGKLVSLANNAYLRGYRNLRYAFLVKLMELDVVPQFAPTQLLSDNYTNYHTKHRWNHKLQHSEIRVSVFPTRSSEKDKLSQDEEIRLYHWLLNTSNRTYVEEAYQSVICRLAVKKSQAWVCDPCDESNQLVSHTTQVSRMPG